MQSVGLVHNCNFPLPAFLFSPTYLPLFHRKSIKEKKKEQLHNAIWLAALGGTYLYGWYLGGGGATDFRHLCFWGIEIET